jgi:putative spermidine/putrescine transport system substrate-binding protein
MKAGGHSTKERKENMKGKKVVSLVMAGAMTAALLAGCGSSASKSTSAGNDAKAASSGSTASAAGNGSVEEFNLYATGSDNVRAIFETLTEDFNNNSEYAGKYKCNLTFMLSGTGAASMTDGLVAAYKANQKDSGYDLVDLSGDDLSKVVSQIGEEAFVKLDKSKIPNASGVEAKSSVAADYVQPYRGTTVVLAYDSDKVTDVPKTWDDLTNWIKANPGRFAYNQPGTGGAGDSFARTSVYNYLPEEAFTSDDPSWEDKWDEGFDYLKDIHSSMYKSGGAVVYPAKNQGTLDLLNQGEIDMCPNWADMVLSQRKSGQIKDSIKIAQITDKPLTGSLQSLAMPTFGAHQDAAYAFINYMLSEEAQQTMVTEMAAIPLIDTSKLDMSGFEDLENLDTTNFRIQSIGALSTDFNERWDNDIATLG